MKKPISWCHQDVFGISDRCMFGLHCAQLICEFLFSSFLRFRFALILIIIYLVKWILLIWIYLAKASAVDWVSFYTFGPRRSNIFLRCSLFAHLPILRNACMWVRNICHTVFIRTKWELCLDGCWNTTSRCSINMQYFLIWSLVFKSNLFLCTFLLPHKIHLLFLDILPLIQRSKGLRWFIRVVTWSIHFSSIWCCKLISSKTCRNWRWRLLCSERAFVILVVGCWGDGSYWCLDQSFWHLWCLTVISYFVILHIFLIIKNKI